MKESLERQDSAAVFELLGEHDRAVRQASAHRAAFDAAFVRAAGNITEADEPEVIAAIKRDRDEYVRRYDGFLHASGNRTGVYFPDLEPRFAALKDDCDRRLRVNQVRM